MEVVFIDCTSENELGIDGGGLSKELLTLVLT
jgi:hypothetical protein